MSVASSQVAEIEDWTGRLLAIAGAVLLVEAASGISSGLLAGVPFSWLLTSIPVGIGFTLAPLVVLRSSQFLADRTPRVAVLGVAFVAALPVGTIVVVAWGLLAHTSGFVPDVAVLPVGVSAIFFTLLGSFAVGLAIFGLAFLHYDRTRLLGGSLLLMGAAWAISLAVAKLVGVYPGWLADLLVVSVATAMLAIGYTFPPTPARADTAE